jgi:hypothetical protein
MNKDALILFFVVGSFPLTDFPNRANSLQLAAVASDPLSVYILAVAMIKPLTSPDSDYVQAAKERFELGRLSEADKQLQKVSAENQMHPDILEIRWEIYALVLTRPKTYSPTRQRHPFVPHSMGLSSQCRHRDGTRIFRRRR